MEAMAVAAAAAAALVVATNNMIIVLSKIIRMRPSDRKNYDYCQFVVAMGGSVYCRTCAAPTGHPTEVMIDIFENAKLITLLSTIKEWQLDIKQDDGLSQYICEKCESALIKIDKFRVQALRTKEYLLQTQLRSLEIKTLGREDADAISDNENDLHAKTNYDGVETSSMEAIPNAFPAVLSNCKAMHILDKQILNVKKINDKSNEREEQLIAFELSLDAVGDEETGELSIDSNIESTRPLEFQIVLIEEEEETKLQWINEDENAAAEKGVQLKNNESTGCDAHLQENEVEFDTKNSSTESNMPQSNTQRSNINATTANVNKANLNKDISFGLQISPKRINDYNNNAENYKKTQTNICTENCDKNNAVSKLATFNELKKDKKFLLGATETVHELSAPSFNKIEVDVEQNAQLNEIETLLVAINEQVVASFESGKESNDYDYTTSDLQSVLMNEITLQMISANVNILEEDLQIDEFEKLLAAVDEHASTLGSIRSHIQDAELPEEQIARSMGFAKESKLDVLDDRESLLKVAKTKEEFSHLNADCTKISLKKMHIISNHSTDELKQSDAKQLNCYKNIPFGELIDQAKISPTENIQNDTLFATKQPKRSNNKTPSNIRCRLCVCNISEQPIFATTQLLEHHIATIHDDKERPYNCPQCAARYRTRSGCVAHINAIHLKKGDSCELCGKVVAGGSGQMRMHMERNHTHGNYTCEICHLELKNVSLYNFKYHQRWHNEDKLWRCELCRKAFVTRTHLLAHKVTHTRQGEFLCTRCGKSTRSKWELRAHLYGVHGEGEAPLKCNFCEEKFTQHIQKRAHLERYHPMELAKSTLPCPKCEKQFSTETNLQRHLKKQHQQDNGDTATSALSASSPPQYEGFMCAHCPRKYRSKYSLIKHLGVHAAKKDRPYSCSDCDMHFKHFSELDRHDLQHHATFRPYKCWECGKAFSTKTALKIHGQVHEVKGKNFRCSVCNKRFKFEKSLNLHRISHKTMRHSCDICNKSYIRLAQLKTHKNRYHKITSESAEE